MKGNQIIVTSKPRGVFEHVYITGTPKPGTCMEIKPSTEPVAGCFNYQAYGTQAASSGQYVAADGDKKAIAILLEKDDEGGTYDRAYVAGEMGRIYWPAMGEQFNMLFEDVSGTGDTKVIGEEQMVDNGTGKLIAADDNAEVHPFTLLETVGTAPTADNVQHVRYNGSGGA
jgi:hypothetical protein